MLPKTHIILGFVFSWILFNLFPNIGITGFVVVFISSFMIDIDHYLFYVFHKKDINPKNAFTWFISKNKKYLALQKEERKSIPTTPCIFHGIEVIILLAALSFVSNIFFFILIGFIFHELLDFINITYYKFSYNHILSQTYNILKYKTKPYSD